MRAEYGFGLALAGEHLRALEELDLGIKLSPNARGRIELLYSGLLPTFMAVITTGLGQPHGQSSTAVRIQIW